MQQGHCGAIAIVFLLASTALADTVTIGPNGINSAGLGLTGAGVVIGQVERFRPGDAEAGDDLAHRNTTTNPAGVFEQNGFVPPDSLAVMNHPQQVAGIMISTDATDGEGPLMNGIAPTGVATGASLFSSAYITDGTDPGYQHAIQTLQFIATRPGMRAVNHSWGKPSEGGGFPLDGSSLLTLGFDWSVRQHNVLHIIAGNEGNMVPIPKDNFNGMTIGRSIKVDGVYRKVSPANTFDEDAAGERTSIALIAPGDEVELTGLGNTHSVESGTSLAAPHVTGTIALLQEAAGGLHSTARQHEVMKAVLLNSADKIEGYLGMQRTVLKKNGDNWLQSNAYTTTVRLTPE